MNDRELKHLMDRMHTLSGSVKTGHELLNDPEEGDPEIIELARKLKEESSLLLADLYNQFINEIIGRRHNTGNFQYPLEPFDEYGTWAKQPPK